MPVINRMGAVSNAPRPSASESTQFSASPGGSSGYNVDQLIAEADKMGDKADDYKYQIAVEMARSNLGDEADADDEAFKSEIDRIFEGELQAGTTGREQRGENILTDAINGVGDFFDAAADVGGGMIDWGFDNTVGNLQQLVFGDDSWKDWFDGDDAAMVADSIIDFGLSAIPGVGLGLATIKNAAQMYPTIQEAVYGTDNVTGEDLTGMQRLGAVGSSLLGVGASMIPGWGGAKISGTASDLASDIAKSATKEAAEETAQAGIKGAAKQAAEAGAAEAVEEAARTGARQASSSGVRGVLDRLLGRSDGALGSARSRIADNVSKVNARYPITSLADQPDALSGAGAAIGNVRNAVMRVPGYAYSATYGALPDYGNINAIKSILTSDASLRNIARNEVAKLPTMLKNTGGNIAASMGGATLGTMAQTGEDPQDAFGMALSAMADNPLAWASIPTGVGTRRISTALRAPNGGMSPVNYNLMANRFASANREAYGDPDLAELDYVDTTGMTNDELVDWMRYARDDEDAD